ncbi:hypothetical protein SAMN05444398_11283 [Roseovarius pacificus]|uniref:Uncharacterized protein n=1 Tax=Roseovarius pacificus TaxID=337701 RepID=A0A1M7HDC4_9RHOB|nr:hypothetical protein [Roseovarius pacificus]GGO58313.1 hypothetical protein GCM10011315_27580 [Roseovarius pacificus]SHM26137.1 hypothetical protein SAMN05444398_11283 [Roseovarius pacificus]
MIYPPLNLPLNLIGWVTFIVIAYGETDKYLDVWEPLHVLIAVFLGHHAFNIILMIAHIPTALIYSATQKRIHHRIEDETERYLASQQWLPPLTDEEEAQPLDTDEEEELVSTTQKHVKVIENLLYVIITIDTLIAIGIIGAALYILLEP